MIDLLAMTASEALDTPAAIGLLGATVVAVASFFRRRRDMRAARSR